MAAALRAATAVTVVASKKASPINKPEGATAHRPAAAAGPATAAERASWAAQRYQPPESQDATTVALLQLMLKRELAAPAGRGAQVNSSTSSGGQEIAARVLKAEAKPVAQRQRVPEGGYGKVDERVDISGWLSQIPYDSLSVTVDASTGALGRRVPVDFLGTSHEWTNIGEYAKTPQSLAAFARVFKQLGPSPIMRIGGNSQESLRAVPPPATWEALRKLSEATNVRFLIGLPLRSGDMQIAKGIVEVSKIYLGGSIFAFALGNEPGEFGCSEWPSAQVAWE
jgi:hypothetical protein